MENRSKIVHNWLNLGNQQARHGRCPDTLLESRCPYCKSAEDFQHLLTCKAPRTLKFRYDGMMKLRKALNGTQGSSAILRAMKAWTLDLETAVAVSAGTKAYKYAVTSALESQMDIGWEHIFRGFISLEWGRCINTSRSETHPLDKSGVEIHQGLPGLYTFLWKGRNDVLHKAGSECLASVHATLNHDISQMYAICNTFSPILRSYFHKPLKECLKGTP
jgi:hypothetical protein